MNKTTKQESRLQLFSWLVLPILGVWIVTSYLVGITRTPDWLGKRENSQTILGSQTSGISKYQNSTFQWKGAGLITIWFDDAWYSQYSTAFPILEKESLKAALAVPTGIVGGGEYMGWAHIKKLSKSGWEISSHTRSHDCNEEERDIQTLESEILGSKNDLEENGINAEVFVTPCGFADRGITETAKLYYLAMRGSGEGINTLPVEKPYELTVKTIHSTTKLSEIDNWINEAKRQKGWLILAFHQVDESNSEYSVSPDNFLKIISLIKTSQLPVVLPNEALQVTK